MGRTTVTLALFTDSTFEDLIFDVLYEPEVNLADGAVYFTIQAEQIAGPVVALTNFPEMADAINASVRSHYFRSKLN